MNISTLMFAAAVVAMSALPPVARAQATRSADALPVMQRDLPASSRPTALPRQTRTARARTLPTRSAASAAAGADPLLLFGIGGGILAAGLGLLLEQDDVPSDSAG
ncbi:hypothetical protein RM533_06020 [Croceicoccus sp. F390]|uniref:Uncharacterized protein n=1 Tax=Croceicoccus esteveae TaxID=3075597 RepID=A0ABU2ZGM8_9SPHN|nr:hypothetical protein [Croceicoccus sp. F390]MDT0575737.1 hypothetical protein [Croceicoccus sp. F390]